jgi:hypothetical protein
MDVVAYHLVDVENEFVALENHFGRVYRHSTTQAECKNKII